MFGRDGCETGRGNVDEVSGELDRNPGRKEKDGGVEFGVDGREEERRTMEEQG